MTTPRTFTLVRVSWLIATLAICHIARPVAVSAQGSAEARISATVVPAGGAWTAERLVGAVLDRARDEVGTERTGLRPSPVVSRPCAIEESGTLVWLEPVERGATRIITVAHLAN